MRHQTELAEHAADVCVAVLGFAGFAAAGLTPFVTPLAVLGAIGLARRQQSRLNCTERAIARAFASLQENTELRKANFDRACALLKEAQISLDPAILEPATKAGALAFRPHLIRLFLSAIQFEADDHLERLAVEVALSAALECLLGQAEVQTGLTQTILLNLARDQGLTLTLLEKVDQATQRTEAKVDAITTRLAALEASFAKSAKAAAARAKGVKDAAIIDLARRIATDVVDVDNALHELENAVEVAIQVQMAGHVRSKHGDFVDSVLSRAADLAQEGHYDQASKDIDAALKHEQAESVARQLRLLDAGIAQDTLRRDAVAVANRLAHRARVEGTGEFAKLRDVQLGLMRSRGKGGDTFGLKVAIELAKNLHRLADASLEKIEALNCLGLALQVYGDRCAKFDYIQDSIKLHTQALERITRKKQPLHWAATQYHLGTALVRLGNRHKNDVYWADLLSKWDALPDALDGSTKQPDLRGISESVFERKIGKDWFNAAVAAFRRSLEVWSRDLHRTEWAMAQHGLGSALYSLSLSDHNAFDLASEAVLAYRLALEELVTGNDPLEYAKIQEDIAGPLMVLRVHTNDQSYFDQADAAVTKAINVYIAQKLYYEAEQAEKLQDSFHRLNADLEVGSRSSA